MLYPIVFIIGFLLSGIMVFLPHICISKIEEYKEGIDVFALLTAIIPTIIIWLLIGDQ